MYLASASPPVRHANVYGVDMPTRREFVAYNLSEEEICTVRTLNPTLPYPAYLPYPNLSEEETCTVRGDAHPPYPTLPYLLSPAHSPHPPRLARLASEVFCARLAASGIV